MRRALPCLALLLACGPSRAPVRVGEDPLPPGRPGNDPMADDEPAAEQRPPVAERRPVTDTYHGVAVEDAYQWLEGDGEDVQRWSDGQDRYARAVLDTMPGVDAMRDEIRAILAAPQIRYYGLKAAGGKLFALRKDPAKDQAELVVSDGPDDLAGATLVLDPTAQHGALATVDWYEPSPDGERLAVSISSGGSEVGDLHIIEADGGGELEPPILNVQRATAGGDAAWSPDGKTIYYTRYPRSGDAHADEPDAWMQLWSHQVAPSSAEDRAEIFEGLPKIAEITLQSVATGEVLASVQDGDGGTFRHYLRSKKGPWRQLTDWADGVVFMTFGVKQDLWLVSRKNAPNGQILTMPITAKKLSKAKVVPGSTKQALVTNFYSESGLVVTKDRLWAVYQLGGPSELRSCTPRGTLACRPASAPVLAPVSTVSLPVIWGDDVLVWSSSYTTPSSWTRFTPKTGKSETIAALSPAPAVTLDDFEVTRELAVSKDTTEVPLNIVWPKGAPKDGTTPCVVTGYGGYGINQTPYFLASWQPLLRRGVCFVEVNLRGGAELGEDWHRNGMLTKKQNVFDDFAAALGYLAEHGYSSPAHLAIMGGSNGGLLMGATMTQHPELFHAVVSEVGMYDMLRFELSPNGQFNIPEFGTVADKAQFTALHAYSPYHHVTSGTSFPATLMTTGANDGRVPPWNSRKMIAALQAAHVGDAPVLLRTSSTSGHGQGMGMNERIDELAHVEGFLAWQLGVSSD